MKRASSNKLSLNRETLVTLDSAALAQVGGGINPTDVTRPISCFICPQVSKLMGGRLCPGGAQ
jgi:hypothetical protein